MVSITTNSCYRHYETTVNHDANTRLRSLYHNADDVVEDVTLPHSEVEITSMCSGGGKKRGTLGEDEEEKGESGYSLQLSKGGDKTWSCQHGKRRNQCKECGGASICVHGRQRNRCKECGGSSICEHGRRRSRCKECGGDM